MNKRPFYLGAVLLALIAVITHPVARGFLKNAMHRKAGRIMQAQRQHTTYQPDPQALQSSMHYKTLTIVGVVLTVLSVGCMVTAMRRQEKGWYLILILLLFFDVLAPMLL
jgi:multisubunit Na+/H+ antiporter MnhG subunit